MRIWLLVIMMYAENVNAMFHNCCCSREESGYSYMGVTVTQNIAQYNSTKDLRAELINHYCGRANKMPHTYQQNDLSCILGDCQTSGIISKDNVSYQGDSPIYILLD